MGMSPSTPNPQAAAPDAGGQQQANPLTQGLGKIVMLLRTLSQQNTSIQPELDQASQILVQAVQKIAQSSSSAPQQPQSPPQQ